MSIEGFQGTQYSLTIEFMVFAFSILGKVTDFYGPQNVGDKREFLLSLRHLREGIPNSHWVVGGYFNLITSLD